MVRLKFEVEPNVERLEGGAEVKSWSADGVEGAGVEGMVDCGVCWGLCGAFRGDVAPVLTARGGFAPGAVPCWAGGKAAAV